MQFSLRTILIIVALAGWLVCVFLPGGVYVTLPIGMGILLLVSSLLASRDLLMSGQDKRRKTRLYFQLSVSVLLLVALLVVYPPFWTFAAGRRDRVLSLSTQRNYVLNVMPAVPVRNEGRMLLDRMNANATKTLFPTSAVVPDSIRDLKPLYVESRDDYLLVVLGKDVDNFYLLIYANGVEGRGTRRLAPGIWFFQPGPGRWITDTDWDRGVRE